jgi:hypothetical protein
MGRKVLLWMLLLVLILFFSKPAVSEILNGGFEYYITGGDFNTPADWNTINYTAVVSNFVPHPEKGHTGNWQIDVEAGLDPFEGDSFVVLSTGDVDPDPQYAMITQRLQTNPGESLFGVYFFGTCDYMPYNDYASIMLVPEPNSGLRVVELVNVNVSQVGSYGSMDGWAYFESEPFTEVTASWYQIEITITDWQDKIFKSYLAVDGLHLCVRPEEGNINNDCHVDMLDYAILALHWLNDCNSPDWCEGADIDNDGIVDANDLSKITNNWLAGQHDP